MEQILLIRELIIALYKRYEVVFIYVIKFIVGLIIFGSINKIGFVRPEIATLTKNAPSFTLTALMSILFTFLPINVGYALMIAAIFAQLSATIEVAVFVTGFLAAVLFLYARLDNKESFLIIATILAFNIKLPYLVPLVAGLYFSLTSVIPVTIGVFIYSFIPIIKNLMTSVPTADLNIFAMPQTFSDFYVALLNNITSNQQWVFTSFIFSMTIIVVYIVSRLSLDYAREISIIMGAVLNIVSYIIAVMVANLDIDIFIMILLTIFCALATEIITFFDMVLDYQRAERVSFSDNENFYYVKIIPKVILSKRERVVKRILPNNRESQSE